MDYSKTCIHCMNTKPTVDAPCPCCGHTESDSVQFQHQLPARTVLKERYLLGRVLAQDALGFLYLSLDLHRNELRAVRELFPTGICYRTRSHSVGVTLEQERLFSTNRSRILQETDILSMLQRSGNEAIVQLLDHFEENDTVYLVFEYHDAIPLRQYINENKLLPLEQIASLMQPIGQTISKIHSFGAFHGNIRPDSILIRREGGALLSDFGPDGIDFDAPYISQEQRLGSGISGAWSDVYSFAGCLFFCLTQNDPKHTNDPADYLSHGIKTAGRRLDRAFISELTTSLNPLQLKRPQRIDTLLQTMSSMTHQPNSLLWTILSVVACMSMILTFLMGSPNSNTLESAPMETISTIVATESTTVPVLSEVTLGSYLFVNYADPNLIIGIEGGYGDNGARLILTDYEESNRNRLLITDHVPDDGFYNLQVAHTNSFLSAEAPGEPMTQYFSMQGIDSEKWQFFCMGEVNGRKIYTLQDASGYTFSPKDGVLTSGTELVLSQPDPSAPEQQWYLVWSERNIDEDTLTVYLPGDAVLTLDGCYTIHSASIPELNCTFTGVETPQLVFAESEYSLQLRFERQSNGQYRIFPVSEDYGADVCLEYSKSLDRLVLCSISEAEEQFFSVIYAGWNTYQILNSSGELLYLQSSADNSCPIAVGTSRDSLIDALALWRLTKSS